MSLRISIILQMLGMFLQTVIPAVPNFPEHWVPFVHALVSYIQGVLGLLAHISNTDGTPLINGLKIKIADAGKVAK